MKLHFATQKRIQLLAGVAAAAAGTVVMAGAAVSARAEQTMATRLMGMAMSDGQAYAIAESLTDGVGARPSGSPNAAKAVDWAVAKMKALGLKNVHTEPVRVPRWIRGDGRGGDRGTVAAAAAPDGARAERADGA